MLAKTSDTVQISQGNGRLKNTDHNFMTAATTTSRDDFTSSSPDFRRLELKRSLLYDSRVFRLNDK